MKTKSFSIIAETENDRIQWKNLIMKVPTLPTGQERKKVDFFFNNERQNNEKEKNINYTIHKRERERENKKELELKREWISVRHPC